MRLLRLQLENWRSHSELDLPLDAVSCAAIVGNNGAGKSSLLLALDFVLTGNGSADELISRHADRGGVTLELEQSDRRWRINRGRERGRKSWCVVEEEKEGKFTPLAQRTIAESQEIIETRILGMDGDAWRASIYAAQGEVGALAALTPGKRKELIGGLLGLSEYEDWREKASLESRAARSEADSARERLGDLEGRIDEARLRFEDTEAIGKSCEVATNELKGHEKELDAAIEREAATEKVRRREALVGQMEGIKQAAQEAKQREDSRATAEKQIAALELAVKEFEQLEALKAAHDEKVAQREALERELGTQEAALEECVADIEAVQAFAKGVEVKIEEAKKPGAICSQCGQEIDGEHRARAIGDLEAQLQGHLEKIRDRCVAKEELLQRVEVARKRVDEAATSQFDDETYAAAREKVRERERAEATLVALQGGSSLAELRSKWAALKAEAAELPEEVPPGPSPTEVREHIATCQDLTRRLEETLRSDKAARAEAGALEDQRTDLKVDTAEVEVDERAYAVVAKAFSRDGIPAMILDNAVGGIEAATNETLEQLGVEMSVRLVTQRATKSGGLTETLDILVDDGTTEAPLESFSGGERARVHIALRLGLASVLSAGADLELGFLLIDEVPDVDAAGIELLADLLTRLPHQILLVSHDPELVAALPQRIIVERAAGAASAVSVR